MKSTLLEDAFRCHTWPHAVEFPILLRQVLFGEMSIKLRAESSEKRRGHLTVQRARLEHEAAERLAHDDDGGHGNI